MPMLSGQNKTKPMQAGSKTAAAKDAIALLKADHKEVSGMLEKFEGTRSASAKQALVAKICAALTVHARIEEEIFYPAAREALKASDEDLLDEAEVEHDTIKKLVSELEKAPPDADFYDAKVKVLGEYVKHHVHEEETELFPKLRKTKIDLDATGEELAARKKELMGNGGEGDA